MIDALASSPVTRAAGLALVQFLWQGALIGAATWLALRTLSRASARSRYAVACVGLTVMVATPVATTLGTLQRPAVVSSSSVVQERMATSGLAPIAGPDTSQPSRLTESWFQTAARAQVWIEARVPWIVTLWAAGVLWFALRLIIGGLRLRSIRRSATAVSGNAVSAARAIARRLGVRRPVRLLASPRVVVPAVAGWIAPVILLPAAVLAGMPAIQLEAILAHELAHVRRGDFLINVLQCAAEALLFFHPAVWWVSRQIRLERELCADDLAVAVSADRVTYAHALAALESLRADSPLAIGAGGDLLVRVRRLIDPDATPPRLSGGTVMTVAVVILMLVSVAVPARTAPQEPTAPATPVVVPSPPVAVENARVPPRRRPAPARAEAPARQAVDAQAQRGHLTGTVQDPSGAVLPGVTVVLAPVAAGGRGRAASIPPRQAITNASGRFVFDDLDPVQYDLTATLIGFRENRSRVTVRPDTRIYASVQLELGRVSQELTITSNATPRDPRGAGQGPAAEYFDLAKLYYQQGRLAEAEEMTAAALRLMRSQTQETRMTAEPSAPAGPIRVGGEIREPRKTNDVKPIYPAEAAAAGVEGTVFLEATIGRDGKVTNARVLRGVAGLDDAALGAVRQWQFTPTLLNGMPVDVLMMVSVKFVR